jgi:uncharacterized membrane protein
MFVKTRTCATIAVVILAACGVYGGKSRKKNV